MAHSKSIHTWENVPKSVDVYNYCISFREQELQVSIFFLAVIQKIFLSKKLKDLKVFSFPQNSHLKDLKYNLHYNTFLPHFKKELNLAAVVGLGGDNLLSLESCESHVFPRLEIS